MRQIFSILLIFAVSFASKAAETHEEHHDHHESEEVHEENANVGAGKGITEYNDEAGFKLSPEAEKNFSLKFLALDKKGPWSVPSSAVLYAGEEINIYRVRSGFFKRVDFVAISKKSKGSQIIQSAELRAGDQIVIEGVGFLRAAEIVATGGAPEGHSH